MASERFLRLLELSARGPDECWNWQGHINKINGYPFFGCKPAYRASWEHFVGPVPAGHEVDHLCKNPKCINPKHLEPVLPYVNNVLRSNSPAAVAARKTECSQGHPFDEQNTYVRKDGCGKRVCRMCRKLNMRKYTRERAIAREAAKGVT